METRRSGSVGETTPMNSTGSPLSGNPSVTVPVSEELAAVLARLRRRIRLYVAIEGTALLLVLLAVLFWASLGIDWAWFRLNRLELPVWFRVLFDVSVASVATVAAVTWIGLRWLRRFRARALALVLERRFPELDDRLITAVEIADVDRGGYTPLGQAMINRTLRDVVEASRRIEVDDVFQKRPLLRAVALAVGLLVSIGGLAMADSSIISRWADGYLSLKESYWPREYGLFVTVVRGPGHSDAEFDVDGVYRHPRGEDLVLAIEVRPDPSRKEVKPLDRVEVTFRQAGGSGRAVCAKTDSRQFRHTRAALLEDLLFWVSGGDYVNRRPYQIRVVDPPTVEKIVLNCRYPEYTGLEPVQQEVQGIQVELPLETDVLLQARTNKSFTGMRVEFDQFRLMLVAGSDGSPTAWFEQETSEGQAIRKRAIDPALLLGTSLELPSRIFRLPVKLTTSAARGLDEIFGDENGNTEPLSGPIPLPADVLLRFSVHDTDDITSRDPARLTINGIVDQPPVIETTLQGIGIEVTRIARIPIAGLIRDDYGIDNAHFEYQLVAATTRVDALKGPWLKRSLSRPPHDRPREFSLATAADDVPRDDALKTPENQQAAWFDLRQLNPEPAVGQKLVLTLVATDADDRNGPHSTRGSPVHVFSIVSNEDLQFALIQKELNLRRRFEQVISEVERTRADLLRHRMRVDERKAETPYQETATDAARAIDAEVINCAERSINEASKSHNETTAIAQEFAGIRDELINNGIHTPQALQRIDDGVLSPLQRINTDDYTDVEAAVRAFARVSRKGDDPAAEIDAATDALQTLLTRMKQVLREMQKLETYQEALKLLKQIIDEEGKLLEKTREQRKRDLIKKLKGIDPGGEAKPESKPPADPKP